MALYHFKTGTFWSSFVFRHHRHPPAPQRQVYAQALCKRFLGFLRNSRTVKTKFTLQTFFVKRLKSSRTVRESKPDTSAACVANWSLTQEFHYGIGCPCGPCRLIPPAQITHVQSKTNCFRRWAQCCRVGWKVRWFSGFKRMSARAAGTHGVHKVRHHTIAGVHQRPSHPSTPDVLIWLFISRRTITVIKMLIVFCSFLTCKNNVMMALCIELWGPMGTFRLIDISILF